jgi:CheY-like chemotaxis protein
VRVSARAIDGGQKVAFSVADTGIGIAAEDQERIFQEFAQIDHPLQRQVRGTGLGLPLCRRLAGLLGGAVLVESEPGMGSIFTAEIPVIYQRGGESTRDDWTVAPHLIPVLFVEDDPQTLLIYEKYLMGSAFGIVSARTLREAREAIACVKPRAIVLDIVLAGEDSWALLTELKRNEATQAIPVMVVSTVEDQAKALALGSDAYYAKPIDRSGLVRTLSRLVAPRSARRVLVVDDDEIARYVLRQSLIATPHEVLEASGGNEGLAMAERELPDLVFLDLSLPDLDGYEVLRRLSVGPATRGSPVVILSSARIGDDDRRRLELARAILDKEDLSAERVRATIDEVTGLAEAAS